MKIAHPVISVILVFLMITSSLPHFLAEDANRDTAIGLDDAILQVKGFSRSAENPAAFSSGVGNMLATLHAVAGLRTIITPDQDSRSASPLSGVDVSCLMSSYEKLMPSRTASLTSEPSSSYQSIVITPCPPPPQPI